METMLTVSCTPGWGVKLCRARRLTEEERGDYLPEYRDWMLVGQGGEIPLPHVLLEDLPQREPDGEFPGGYNRTWIVTQAEWDAMAALEAVRAAEAQEKARQAELSLLNARKAEAERQAAPSGVLPTRQEAKAKAKDWVDTYNEGADGYVPYYYSGDEYAEICARIAELEGGEEV